ncbi:hypothetical protein C0W92_20505 [Photobacterium angustum]|uniref:DUF2780 domain-containing protein n=1 Tax=Photobacterium angustum TaxID=661 RepID=A0A2S7VRM8_PHOAN|nr:DUF2780 domain-containing protein [Photobacterium angustum]KJF83645.1 hypothetical protein UB36_03810 [Photobacterium damselae subsp. damselae]KJG00073.1 hypothetical protein UB35_20035 [Photobacterium angustum]KJG27756.1 hypothetical protein UA69_18745 [Photobacterium angustum]KJG35607.1 hypothetical protein UA35_20800 [Photobacterium angustum]KJG44750.1 hypothetical protein UA30_20835 [Photobacterium angustum]
MEKRHILTTLTAVALLSSSAMSHAFSLSDVASAFGGEKSDQVATQIAENPLTKALVSDLGVKPEQAAGGAGALLAMATSELTGPQGKELTQLIPGAEKLTDSLPLGLGQLLGSKENIDKVFSLLGMKPEMVNQFVPVVTQFLGEQGASNELLGALSNIWSPAAPVAAK